MFKKLQAIAAATSHEAIQCELLDEVKVVVQEVCSEHVYAIQAFIKDPILQTKVTADIENDCQELIDYVIAAKRFNLEVNARSKDRVVSFGEKLSCRFMAYLLQDRVCRPPWGIRPVDQRANERRPARGRRVCRPLRYTALR